MAIDIESAQLVGNHANKIAVLLTSWDNVNSLQMLNDFHNANISTLVISSEPHPTDGIFFLQCGAADYLAEPADLREIELRLRVLRKFDRRIISPAKRQLHFNQVTVDLVERVVERPDGKRYRLTATECRLLTALVERQEPLSRAEIGENIASRKASRRESRAGDVLISSLRRKIDIENAPSLIVSVRGRGYAFRPPAE
jgi:DNA-binding response OmpR family regulator